jgi:hypothetical protein
MCEVAAVAVVVADGKPKPIVKRKREEIHKHASECFSQLSSNLKMYRRDGVCR